MEQVFNFGYLGVGAVLALSAIGSAFGVGAAGQAAIGAWKKCFQQNKNAPFLLVAFVGAPLTQTIYGFILIDFLKKAIVSGKDPWLVLGAGILGGIAIAFSAFFQGKAGAVASDALAETGKGFGNYILVLGLAETIALFVMVFVMVMLG